MGGAFDGLIALVLAVSGSMDMINWPWFFFEEGAIDVLLDLLTTSLVPPTLERATCLIEEANPAAIVCIKFDAHRACTKSDAESETIAWTWAAVKDMQRREATSVAKSL